MQESAEETEEQVVEDIEDIELTVITQEMTTPPFQPTEAMDIDSGVIDVLSPGQRLEIDLIF